VCPLRWMDRRTVPKVWWSILHLIAPSHFWKGFQSILPPLVKQGPLT
jgi:hypothetical protein